MNDSKNTIAETKFPWLVTMIVLGLILIGVYYDVILKMADQWSNDPNNSHGFLIPLISAYLLWERRAEIKKTVIAPSNIGLLVLIFGIVVYVIGNVGAELFTMRFSIIIVLTGLVIFLLGFGMLRAVMLPLGYLILMIPIPYILYDAVAFPLKLFAAHTAVEFLKFISIPVYREGNIISLAQTTLEVADACSGIRSLMSLIALSIAISYFMQKGWQRRVMLVVFAVPIAILVNVLRVIITGMLAHKFGEKAATGFFHEFSGFVMFGVAMAILVLFSVFLRKFRVAKKAAS